MFSTCSVLTSLDLRCLDTSQVTTMDYMFSKCFKLANLNVSKFNTSKVENMENMFLQCKVLPSIDLSHFDTSKVTNFQFMFSQCEALTELDLSSFDTSNVTNVNNFSGMFNRCENIETIYVSDKFITPNEEMSCFMFAFCKKLVGAIEFDENRTGNDMANSKTGYFKAYKNYGTHKVEKVELYGNKAHYLRNHTYEWATICLPFAFSTNDNAAYRFYELKGVEGNSLSVSPLTGDIAAGTPVFVRGANAAGNKIEIVGVDDVLTDVAQTQSTTTANLVGTFADKEGLAADNYIILKDKFWLADELLKGRPGSRVNINALRAHITPAAPLRAAVLTISAEGEGTVTGIDAIDGDVNSVNGAETFDLQGRRIDSLQRGVNIVRIGGKTKKIVVK